jgi:hypothetical protein
MRSVTLALVTVALAGSLAACGSGQKKSTTTTGPSAEAQIKAAYLKFFSSNTSLADRVALLQNGPRFQAVVKSFASNPLAKNTSAKVSSVTLQGANKAKVVYTVSISGSSLPKQTGFAVLQSGEWKVGDASLCKLIELGGTTPSVCKAP